MDPSLGPLVLSVLLEEEESRLRVILRLRSQDNLRSYKAMFD